MSLRVLAASALLAAVSATGASAQASLNVDVEFDFPALIVLSCFDTVTVELDGDTLLTDAGFTPGAGTADTSVSAAGAGPITLDTPTTGQSFDATGVDPATGDFSSVDVTVNGVCGIRALGTGADVGVDLTLNESTLDGSGSGSITISTLGGRDGGTTVGGATGAFTTVAAEGDTAEFAVATTSGFGTVQYVDVQFDLDLSDALDAGSYGCTSCTDGVFTVTVAAD